MIIIADGGSTKTNWCLVTEEGKKVYFNTEGYNPYFSSTEYIIQSLNESLPTDLEKNLITEVNYYGAGCSTPEMRKIVEEAMKVVFVGAKVNIGHDLLAAARALLGNTEGFAAILGTGTNTCIYDGKEVVHNIDSGAYILGDEGSGCYIGKKLLTDYLRGYMPEPVRALFWETYKLTPDDINEQVYTQPRANRFCASFSKFVYDNNVHIEYSRNLVRTSFEDFFRNLVTHYPDYQKYTFNCIGSVGYNFRNVLEEVVTENGMVVGNIIRSPIDNLVKYHLELAPSSL
ncbi:N-acetylglucosamine kinase [Mucilaginibacter rubeus]|uniref:N-acetylglucosamine kinase n=1 Tax=Mucilaginibacter rubeus TaxID=2027860 RepID=A0AAE6JB40_9SPHI|nr:MULTISPECIES: N-acetylglucosamine kinase [Mucilaginibacter]QEM02384.1 N-acetylglucosamine kinase [Mucilaginibacter rubeus]QEM15009.1 N-acetylglucosamine kinase [Mucilaginibacter gossypii]QTE42275.1 N-acetylglucosamine kinase [Mucilaginibacter rubeus]QTE48876.1 N-acetylglucosamine kinase [Mucilaginibacter rubeus]QTE53973.1 N-acetylglucosamine kinase [Mucilaginibacter rubeus]